MRPDSLLDKTLALQAPFEKGSLKSRSAHTAPDPAHFSRLLAGIAVMLGDPETHVAQVFMDQVVLTVTCLAIQKEMFMHFPLLISSVTASKQTQIPAWIPAAMADPFAVENQLQIGRAHV